MRYVVIGNGIAGIHALEMIRAHDPEGSITVVAGEPFPPYCRPMISLLLEGAIRDRDLPIRPPDFYGTNGVEAVVGERVEHIDVENRVVVTDRARKIPYDRLLVASGADPRGIKAQGLGLRRIFFMRNQAHVQGMVHCLPEVKRALVLGGGLVGFKAAYGLLRRGVQVTMLIRSDYPLSMQVDSFAGGLILDELVRKGLQVRVGSEAVAFEGNGAVREAHLDDGSALSCEMVVIGKGVRPATSFLPRERIQVDLGVLVDDRLETSVPGVYAAGDVAEHFDVARKCRWVNAIWPVAVEQGRVAGMNMAGLQVTYKGSLGRNVMRVFDVDVLSGGLVNPPDEGCRVLADFSPRQGMYRKLVMRDGKLVGLVMVNRIEEGGTLLSLIHQEVPIRIPDESLLAASFNCGRLLTLNMGTPQAGRSNR
ncbi:MAG: NAD(P)/FAD-dependent oxidoreductase [Syntrophobacteraceae bacterium]|nr:NAD(P)/FAD-dependent oxidoreductase [Syntrophobacteraceae bacterium]